MKPSKYPQYSRPTTAKKPLQSPILKSPARLQSRPYPHNPKTQPLEDGNPQSESPLGPDTQLQTYIQSLLAMQKQAQAQGKYIQAQQHKRKIKALQQQLQRKDMILLREKHEKDRRAIDEAHRDEMDVFHIQWEKVMGELEEEIVKKEEEIVNRHEEELRVVEEEIMGERDLRFKESAELLNLKKIQQQLAKQQNYLQAHQVQLKAQKLQKSQLQKHRQLLLRQNKSALTVLSQKHENQLNALRQRLDLLIDEKRKMKQQQEQQLKLKYQNVLKEMEYKQKQDVIRFQKAVKLSAMQKSTGMGVKGIMSASKVSLH